MKKNSKAGLAGKAKRITAAALAGCMLYCGGMQVSAATLKDVFDEHYYADTYPDLKEAFGYNREALWQHFMRYGVNEGRNMNELIDIVKYREMYSDLDAAFGNNWNAYLNHYLTFGAKENRETGTDFNALDYAGRYEDLQAAYGTNVLALWNHYRTSGAAEGREARDERILQAEEDAARAAEEAEETGTRTERVELHAGWWAIREYDINGKFVKATTYKPDGSVSGWSVFEDDKTTNYNADGSIRSWGEITERYNNGIKKKSIQYNGDGSKQSETEYDSTGLKKLKETYYSEDGSYSVSEYNSDGSVTYTRYNADGTVKE